jgi:peptidyl-prolyl cis-trans isomerase A (cyclophilin A)
MKTILTTFALLLFALPSFADKAAPPPADQSTYATFHTSAGDIVVKLYDKDAPKTVENFVGLATGTKEWTDPSGKKVIGRPLYNGTKFHRVLPKFMIQGGDPNSAPGGDASMIGRGGPGYKFEDEFSDKHKFDKGGYLAMANAGPNTNGSQFFITEVPVMYLNGKHTIFGEVVSGLDLVPKIVAAGNGAVTLTSVEITKGKPGK